ncbi:MAG: hypothetical protein WCC60_12100 [Ilumatobacteraceae bacterium]
MTRRRVLVTMGSWATLVVSLWVSHSRPAVLVLGGLVAALAATVFVLIDLSSGISRMEWTRRSSAPGSSGVRDRRVESLHRQARGAWWTGSTQIDDTLVELVDDRLLAHHRIDRGADPGAAGEMLTPTLRRLVAGPRRQTAAVRELRQILTDIEAL